MFNGTTPLYTAFLAPETMTLPRGLDRGTLPRGPALEDVLPEPVCVPGERAARTAMNAWLNGPIDAYADRHDDLAGGTSALSPYLRWGCLSPRELEVLAGSDVGRDEHGPD